MNSRLNTRALWGLAVASFFAAAMSLGQAFEPLHTFSADEGCRPQSGLIQLPDGTFAGTTIGCPDEAPWTSFQLGSLFQIDTSGHFRTLHEFDWTFDGANPHAPLLLTPDGDLYGTTKEGLLGWGGVYKLMPDRRTLNVMHAFIPSTAGAQGEGSLPHAPLILAPGAASSEGQYFGVTTEGGKDGWGTIFSINDHGVLTTLHHFSGTDGAYPFEALILVGNFMYGTTTGGGTTNSGTKDNGVIYRIDIHGKNFSVIHNFNGNDGAVPEAPLIHVNGALYGTTSKGGSNDLGTVFKYNIATGRLLVLHNFAEGDGTNPHAGLVLARDGSLYGTTSRGGPRFVEGCDGPDCSGPTGTIFKITPPLNRFSIVHTFHRWDGSNSQSRLIEGSDGSLYGTTSEGGNGHPGYGVIFRLVFARVDAINPTSVSPYRHTAFWLSGANFLEGAAVYVGGLEAEDILIPDTANISAKTPLLPPGMLVDVVVDNPNGTRGGKLNALFVDFLDVPQGDIFHSFVEAIFRNRITVGIGEGNFGRDFPATRAQMAVFLLKAVHGYDYVPPAATGTVFLDVAATDRFASWIEELSREGITAGCDGGIRYCPTNPMTREQMALMLLKAKHSSAFQPPACQGLFLDVPCTSEFAPWIEQLYREGITAGCNGGNYFCPAAPTTRGQTAVFLTKAFFLP